MYIHVYMSVQQMRVDSKVICYNHNNTMHAREDTLKTRLE